MTILPIGRIIPTDPLHQALSEGGYGCIVITRNGSVEYARCWPNPAQSLCDCTDCGRNQPLEGCPKCDGRGRL